MNALGIQEIVDCCLDFLHDPTDLRTCALVGPLWTCAARRHLFHNLRFDLQDGRNRLDGLSRSNRFTGFRFVRKLQFNTSCICDAFLSMIPTFTGLQQICVSGTRPEPLDTAALSALLSLPTLTCVAISCVFQDISAFIQIWIGCSQSIRHLELSCPILGLNHPWSVPGAHSAASIKLDSLRLLNAKSVLPWLVTNCPFSFQKTQQIGKTIQVFQFTAISTHAPIDLGRFTRLRHLIVRISGDDPVQMAVNTFSTAHTTHRDLTSILVFPTSTSPSGLSQLDDSLTQISTLSRVEVRMDRARRGIPGFVEEMFPGLATRGLLSGRGRGASNSQPPGPSPLIGGLDEDSDCQQL
ncbi:hypothetical protein FB45DRAFT_1027236 [Roridomyces roridus]|uniref:F-box domain-containing protein n=1 Tax=Roridomyces roridus TaxID=1738132 RepID=A0AAD7FN57_9AGAR|nr:hypothetical protein FB45DRAFT_1027236 [Roridomyces roridus]